MKVRELLFEFAEIMKSGFFIVFAIIFFPLYLFFSLVFHKVTLEELMEALAEP